MTPISQFQEFMSSVRSDMVDYLRAVPEDCLKRFNDCTIHSIVGSLHNILDRRVPFILHGRTRGPRIFIGDEDVNRQTRTVSEVYARLAGLWRQRTEMHSEIVEMIDVMTDLVNQAIADFKAWANGQRVALAA